MEHFENIFSDNHNIGMEILILLAVIVIGVLFGQFILYILPYFLRKRLPNSYSKFIYKIKNGVYFLFPILMLFILDNIYLKENSIFIFINKPVKILFIIVLSWMVIQIVYVVEEILMQKFNVIKEDNKSERKIITQLIFVRKIIIFSIIIVSFSFILMSFEAAQKFGQGLLTSAGVLGLLIGVAAQKSIANLLAGFQIAFTQPIRIDDVVIVEQEWGNVEEINLTYVVIKLWDLRRLVLPLTYFLEKPFQNWTRESAEILGTAFVYVDYNIPIDELRRYLNQILKESKLWNGKVGLIQMTDIKTNCIELRILMSAANSPDAFDLRCEVREKMIAYIQKNYPESLPKMRYIAS